MKDTSDLRMVTPDESHLQSANIRFEQSVSQNPKRALFYGICVVLAAGIFTLSNSLTAEAQDLASFEKKVTEFTLENGLHFIIIKRDAAPVASFVTFVNVGGANEPVGNTGIAHIFEHMAFKGTDIIGTTNWLEESAIIERIDDAYKAWYSESLKPKVDSVTLQALWASFTDLQEQAKTYVVNNEFSQIIERSGGTGLNAYTSADETAYFYNLPQNKAELWFNLEAARFRTPIFREFYVEKDVVFEERRMRTDSNPIGRLIEEFLSVAYSAHPYGNPVVGWPSDIRGTTIEDAHKFYETWYVPSNMTISIAGDVDAKEMRRLAEKYFGDFPKGEPVPSLNTVEPKQRGERRFTIVDASQPLFLSGYHSVSSSHPDYAALTLLGDIVSSGRTSRLYKLLVEQEKAALQVAAFNGFPGTKYPGLFLMLAMPNQGVELDRVEELIEQELEAVKEGAITQEELNRAVTNAKANIVRGLASNSGLALSAASNHAQFGDWRKIFTQLDDLEAVTLDDLTRVAKTYLVANHRTVGMIVREAPGTASKTSTTGSAASTSSGL